MAEENTSLWPKGCYVVTNGNVYWNNHKTGSPNAMASQVCIQQGL